VDGFECYFWLDAAHDVVVYIGCRGRFETRQQGKMCAFCLGYKSMLECVAIRSESEKEHHCMGCGSCTNRQD